MERISHTFQLSRLIGSKSAIVDASVLMGKRPLLPPKLTVFASVLQASQLTEIESQDLTLIIEAGFQDPVSVLLPSWLANFTRLTVENQSLADVRLQGTLKGDSLTLFRVNVEATIYCQRLSIDEAEVVRLSGQANHVTISGQIVAFQSLPDWFQSLELCSDRLVFLDNFYHGALYYSFHNVETNGDYPACKSLSLTFDSDVAQHINCPFLEKLSIKNVALSGNYSRVKCLSMESAAVSKMPSVEILELIDCDYGVPESVKSVRFQGEELPFLPSGLVEVALSVPSVVPDDVYARELWSLDLSGCLSTFKDGERVIPESNARFLIPPEPLCEYRLAVKNLLLDVDRWQVLPNIEGLPTMEDAEEKIAKLIID